MPVTTLLRTSLQMFPWKFSEMSKTIFTAVSLGELINTIKNFWKMNNKHSQVFLVHRKNRSK